MPDTFDLGPATQRLAAVVAAVRDEQLDGPTPCPEMTVGDLLDHIHLLAQAFRAIGARDHFPGLDRPPRPGSADNLPGDWRTAIPDRLGDLAAAWRDDDAWSGMGTAGGVTMPNAVLAVVALDEVVVHGWDLARATGQPYEVDPVSAAVAGEFARNVSAETARGGDGPFGPAVPVPDDAPDFDRTLGHTGRDPHWAPPA